MLIFIGLWIEHEHDWWSKASSEVGIAAVIAGLLIGGSEWYLKERLFSEIRDNVLIILASFNDAAFDIQQFGRLPAPLRQRLSDRLLRVPVIQEEVLYTYDLTSTKIGREDAYRASVTAESKYVNVSTETQEFQVRQLLLACNFKERPADYGFQKICSEVKGRGDFPSELVTQVIQTHVSSRANGPTIFERKAALDPGSELKVRFESVAYLHPDEWISIEAFIPTINIVCETSGAGLKFSAQPSDALSDLWHMTLGGSGEHRWELRGAILPGRGSTFGSLRAKSLMISPLGRACKPRCSNAPGLLRCHHYRLEQCLRMVGLVATNTS